MFCGLFSDLLRGFFTVIIISLFPGNFIALFPSTAITSHQFVVCRYLWAERKTGNSWSRLNHFLSFSEGFFCGLYPACIIYLFIFVRYEKNVYLSLRILFSRVVKCHKFRSEASNDCISLLMLMLRLHLSFSDSFVLSALVNYLFVDLTHMNTHADFDEDGEGQKQWNGARCSHAKLVKFHAFIINVWWEN